MTSPLSMNVRATRVEPGSELIGSLPGRRPGPSGRQEPLPPVGGRGARSGLLGDNQARHWMEVPAVNRGRQWRASACRRGSLGLSVKREPQHVASGPAVGILVLYGREDVKSLSLIHI